MALAVSQAVKIEIGSGTSVTLNSAITFTAGALAVVAVTTFTGGGTDATASDSINGSYTGLTGLANNPTSIRILYKENLSSGLANLTAGSATGNGIVGFWHEVTGAATTSSQTDQNGTTGTSTAPDTVNQSNTTADSIYFAAAGVSGSGNPITYTINAAGSEGTWLEFSATQSKELDSNSFPTGGVVYQIVSSVSARSHTWTTVSGAWSAASAVFKIAAAAGPSAGTVGRTPQMFHPGAGILRQARHLKSQQSTNIPAGLTAYSLTADAGTYNLTGTVAALKEGHIAPAASGTYSITGTNVALRIDHKISAAGGTYAISGTNAALKATHTLSAAAGAYNLTGTATGLKIGHNAIAASGAYTLTGTAAALKATHTLSANSGTYLLTGTAAALRLAHQVGAGAGAYIINGTSATLIYGTAQPKLVAESGIYQITGTNVGFNGAHIISAAAGSYVITGTAAKAGLDVFPPPAPGGGGSGTKSNLGFLNHIFIEG